MFPLNSVVFPHTAMPLRVFEPRYQHLLDDVLAADRRFGTVLIERGSEVGGGDDRFMVGSTLVVASVGRLSDQDHRQVIVAATDRIHVDHWVGEDPYPQAEVSQLPDADEKVAPDLIEDVQARILRVLALASELGADIAGISAELDEDGLTASYQAAALTPVGALDSYRLLAAPGPVSRLELCCRMLDETADHIRAQLGT